MHVDRAQTVKCDLAARVLLSSGRLQFSATGASMLPALWPGDLMTVQSAGIADIGLGEIVLFRLNRSLCLHRVVQNTGGSLITRGDSVPDPDPPVQPSAILGRLVAVQRGRRSFVPKENLNCCQELLVRFLRRSRHFCAALLRLHALRLKLA
jgi:hypothetical protein